ncbi:MAG TPA: hypothetical protein PKK43_10150 [Spirochaetota bacterium]|nr:hypothetical protein [Spirochaetota bacterium]
MESRELERVESLLKELLEIIRKEGGSDQSYAAGELERCVEMIERARDDQTVDRKEVFARVRESYKSMFPPRGGLTDFFVWREDFNERLVANRRLDAVKAELDDEFGV